jgi:hypothetical protein
MDHKNKPKKKRVASKPKSQKKKRRIAISVSNFRRDKPSSNVKMKNLVISSDSSCSAGEGFIEYLWTSMPWEFSPNIESSGREEGS